MEFVILVLKRVASSQWLVNLRKVWLAFFSLKDSARLLKGSRCNLILASYAWFSRIFMSYEGFPSIYLINNHARNFNYLFL